MERTMIERNIKKLLLDKLEETGEDPEAVECQYRKKLPHLPGSPPLMASSCLASSLPEGDFVELFCRSKKYNYELVETNKEIKIETSPNTDPS